MTTSPPHFDLLDGPRVIATNEFFRVIGDHFGYVDASIDETETSISMPTRLVHNAIVGWHLEVGPYDIHTDGIEILRQAIAAYDAAAGSVPGRAK